MPLRPEVRDAQRTLATLDAAHRRAVARLNQALARRAELIAEQDRPCRCRPGRGGQGGGGHGQRGVGRVDRPPARPGRGRRAPAGQGPLRRRQPTGRNTNGSIK